MPCHRSTGWIHDTSYSEQTIVNKNHDTHLLPIPQQKGSQQSLLSRLEETILDTTSLDNNLWNDHSLLSTSHPVSFLCPTSITSNSYKQSLLHNEFLNTGNTSSSKKLPNSTLPARKTIHVLLSDSDDFCLKNQVAPQPVRYVNVTINP